MTVREMAQQLSLKPLAGEEGMEKQVTGCYIGDLLSWAMGRAQEGDAWITVMGNLNAIGVAVLADTSCIILAENAWLDEDARQKADQQGVAVLGSERNSYQLALGISRVLP